MKIKAIMVQFLIILGFLLAAYPAYGLELSLNLAPSDSYDCQMVIQRNIVQSLEIGERTMSQDLKIDWRYDIAAVDSAGNIVIGITYVRVRVNQSVGPQSLEYDSDNPPEYIDPSMKGYSTLIGSKLKVKLDRHGKVLNLDGAEELVDKMITALNIPESPRREKALQEIRGQFGEEALRNSIQQITAFYPDHPVNVGDTWSKKTVMEAGFPMSIDDEYTLELEGNGAARIKVNSVISSNPDSAEVSVTGVKMYYDIKGSQAGTIDVNETDGLPINSSIDMNFEGTVRVTGVPNQPEKSWPIKSDGNVTITFKKR